MAMPTLICVKIQLEWSTSGMRLMEKAYVALVLQSAALLGDAEQVEGLASLQGRYFIELSQRHSRCSIHKRLGGLHSAPITLNKGGREAGRYAQDAEQQEDTNRAVISSQTFGEGLLRDESQLKVVPSELVDSLDDIRQWRQVIPRVNALDVLKRNGRRDDRGI